MLYEENGVKKLGGLLGNALSNITASLNFTQELISSSDGHYGDILPNGTFTGQLMMLDKGIVDVAGGPFSLEYAPYLHFPSTTTLLTDDMKIISGMRDPFVSDSAAFINTFDKETWILFFTSLVCLIALSTFAYRLAGRKRPTDLLVDVSKYTYAYIEVLFFEATRVRFVPLSNRVLLGAWLLACFVLVNLFNGEVKANLLVKSDTRRIETVEDVLRQPKLLPLTVEKSPFTTILQTSGLKSVRDLYERLMERGGERSQAQLFNAATLELVVRRRAVIITDTTGAKVGASPMCQVVRGFFYIGAETIKDLRSTWYFRRDIPRWIVDEFNKRILWLAAMPIPFMRHEDMYPQGTTCFLDSYKQDRSSAFQPLRFEDLRAVFMLKGYMLTTSLGFLVVELLVFATTYCLRRASALKAEMVQND
ncbi:putative glutamate receptor [Haemaphysalis longicornis]